MKSHSTEKVRVKPEKTLFGFGFYLCLVLIISPNIILTASEKLATDHMSEALKLRSKGNLSEAIAKLLLAVETSKSNYQRNLAQFMLGDCLIEDNKPNEARKVFENFLSGNDNDEEVAEAKYRIAQCYSMTGNTKETSIFCKDVINNHPKSPFVELARFLLKTGPGKTIKYDSSTAEDDSASPEAVPSQMTVGKATPQDPITPTEKIENELHRDQVAETDEPITPTPEPASSGPVSSGLELTLTMPDQTLDAKPKSAKLSSQPERQPVDLFSSEKPKVPHDLLSFKTLSQTDKEALASQILQDQTRMQTLGKAVENAEILYRLASNTAIFGEYVEACKNYDRLLLDFPTSPFVEKAYFEAIRLRTILKIYDSVVEWGNVFLKTFPSSAYTEKIKRLIAFSKAPTENSSKTENTAKPKEITESDTAAVSSTKKSESGESDLDDDPRYQQGKRHMAEGKFSIAMADFLSLSKKYPQSPKIWWELALVQVQLQKFTAAEESLKKLLALETDNQEASSLLGYVHYQQKKYGQAAEDYNSAGKTTKEGLAFFDPEFAAQRMQKSQTAKSGYTNNKGDNK